MKLFHVSKWSMRHRFRGMVVIIVIELVGAVIDIRDRDYAGAILIACALSVMVWYAALPLRKLARKESEATDTDQD